MSGSQKGERPPGGDKPRKPPPPIQTGPVKRLQQEGGDVKKFREPPKPPKPPPNKK